MKRPCSFIALALCCALPAHGAFGLGSVGSVAQPWSMEGWTVYGAPGWAWGSIDRSLLKTDQYIVTMFHVATPGDPVQFKCRVSDDGGTWLLFYRPIEADLLVPTEFIQGYTWRDGVLYELTVDGRLVFTEIGRYVFSGFHERKTVVPQGAGVVMVGTYKEWEQEEGPRAAATMELLGI